MSTDSDQRSDHVSFGARLLGSIGLMSDGEPVLKKSDVRKSYQRPPAFTNFLPWVSYDHEYKVFGFDDAVSCGALLELTPLDAEARPFDQLEEMLDKLVAAFTPVPERDENPWVIQLFVGDEPLLGYGQHIREYAASVSDQTSDLADNYFQKMDEHLQQIGQAGGIFLDKKSGVRWSGKYRRVRMCVYRNFGKASDWPDRAHRYPPDELNQLIDSLCVGLNEAGVESKRLGPAGLYNWMVAWFNPKPRGYNNPWELLTEYPVSDEEFRSGYDIAQGVIKSAPSTKKGDDDNGCWYFDDMPHRFLPIMSFRKEPRHGSLMLEKQATKSNTAGLFDKFPEGTIFTTTIVFTPQDVVKDRLQFIWGRSSSDDAESVLTKEDVEDCQAAMARGHPMYPTVMGFYIRGEDDREIEDNTNSVFSSCVGEGIDVLLPKSGVFPLDEYIRYLPMAYKPEYDKYLMREKLQWLMNVMALSPLWGKSSGTGHPGFLFYDRSGNPVSLDILNEADRKMVAHMLIFGPSGAGKSAMLNYLALQTMAIYKPHLYIIDVGDSFRLLGEHFKRQGLIVEYVRLDKANVPLPPFVESERMLAEQILEENDPDYVYVDPDDQRDFLGEMEVAAHLIITGGEDREEEDYRRQDKTIVRAAIVDAAFYAKEQGRKHATIDDFAKMLDAYLGGKTHYGAPDGKVIESEKRERIAEIRDCARYFLDGFRGKIFNTEGEALGDADVTIVDFGKIAMSKDYNDIMVLAFIGMMNTIQSDAEKRRDSGRESVAIIDEGHVTTTHPMLADYLTKGSKMWRKWGLWMWLATQNLDDFPETSAKILNMAEFWLCLSMPKAEIKEIARFRELTEEDESLLLQARKEPGKYVEGVMLSTGDPALIRNVPPAIALALAMTNAKEVAERQQIMQKLGLDEEIDAVYEVEKRIIAGRVK